MEQNQMTPKDAIALLDKVTSTLKLDRNEHNYVIMALQAVQKLDTDYLIALDKIQSFRTQPIKIGQENKTEISEKSVNLEN